MRTALEEIKFRSNSCSRKANIRPAEHRPPAKKAFGYRICGAYYFGAYIYNVAMGQNNIAEKQLKKMIEMYQLSFESYEPDQLASLEAILIAKAIKKEDLTKVSEQILDLVGTNKNESINPLYTILPCLRLGEDHTLYMDWFKKWEAKKYTSVLPGSSEAIAYLINRDEDNLAAALNSMLLAHHKEANNRHSNIYNSHAAFLSLAPYLILELAEHFGMDIRSKISENKQTLKLGMSSPADFPDIPKNYKMPIEVDYLTARANLFVD